MPSRFGPLAPHVPSPARVVLDVYDNVPADPEYVAPVSLQACTRKPTP